MSKYNELPNLSDYYTKEEVDNKINESIIVDKLTFEDSGTLYTKSTTGGINPQFKKDYYSLYNEYDIISIIITVKSGSHTGYPNKVVVTNTNGDIIYTNGSIIPTTWRINQNDYIFTGYARNDNNDYMTVSVTITYDVTITYFK